MLVQPSQKSKSCENVHNAASEQGLAHEQDKVDNEENNQANINDDDSSTPPSFGGQRHNSGDSQHNGINTEVIKLLVVNYYYT